MYKIKQFSKLVGVSVRMLHHYDKIGLLTPERIHRDNGYRYYGAKNFERVQQILLFKELGFGLKEIRGFLDSESFDFKAALSMQRNLLNLKKQRLEKIVKYIDICLHSSDNQLTMENNMNEEMKSALDETAIENEKIKYAQEAREKWGHTDSYKQSQKKLAKYNKSDIESLKDKQQQIYLELAELMPKGIKDPSVQEKVHEARMFINDNWYECSVQQFVALGHMYVADERFKQQIDKSGEGLAEFLNQAIQVYSENHS